MVNLRIMTLGIKESMQRDTKTQKMNLQVKMKMEELNSSTPTVQP